MAKPTLSNAFSWKRGFLENKQKRISNRNVTRNDLPKGPMKTVSPDARNDCAQSQRKITTGTAVAATAPASSKTTDPASLLTSTESEETVHKTHVRNKTANLSAPPSLPTSQGSIPYKTEGFDEGHLHRASPIRGLPPEDKPHTDTTGHVKFAVQPNQRSEEQATATQAFGVGRMAKGHKSDPNIPHAVNLHPEDISQDNQSSTLEPIKHCRLAPLWNSGYQASPTLTPMLAVAPETINQSTASRSLPFCHCYDMHLCLQQNN